MLKENNCLSIVAYPATFMFKEWRWNRDVSDEQKSK